MYSEKSNYLNRNYSDQDCYDSMVLGRIVDLSKIEFWTNKILSAFYDNSIFTSHLTMIPFQTLSVFYDNSSFTSI